jgi:hypothetical protein
MFEAGVTFKELIPALDKEGLRLNMPLLPRLTKSIAGSLLERQPVVMPKYHGDIADPLACMEIIFGRATCFVPERLRFRNHRRTMGSGRRSKEAAGPSSSSWYRIIQGHRAPWAS